MVRGPLLAALVIAACFAQGAADKVTIDKDTPLCTYKFQHVGSGLASSGWGACTKWCETGNRYRAAVCVCQGGTSVREVADPVNCAGLQLEGADTKETCTERSVCLTSDGSTKGNAGDTKVGYKVGPWGQCSKRCADADGTWGTRKRTVRCVLNPHSNSPQDVSMEVCRPLKCNLNANECELHKVPLDTEPCKPPPCDAPSWSVESGWSSCKKPSAVVARPYAACAAGSGTRTRTVLCKSTDAAKVTLPDARCEGPKPPTSQPCGTPAGDCDLCAIVGATCSGYGTCTSTGGCSCVESTGFGGPRCDVPTANCASGVVTKADTCCKDGSLQDLAVLDIDGACCTEKRLAHDGSCCSGDVDGCGACVSAGDAAVSTRVLDSAGNCCASRALLDEEERCCAAGYLDACGVCGGDGASCNIEVSLSLAAASLANQPTLDEATEDDIQADLIKLFFRGVDDANAKKSITLKTNSPPANKPPANKPGGKRRRLADASLASSSSSLERMCSRFLSEMSASHGRRLTSPWPSSRRLKEEKTMTATIDQEIARDLARSGADQWPLTAVTALQLLDEYMVDTNYIKLAKPLSQHVSPKAVCGNNKCEFGERCTDDVCANGCRLDCPTVLKSCEAADCSGHGHCVHFGADTSCQCHEAQGYTGTKCDECLFGYVPHNGKCVVDTKANVLDTECKAGRYRVTRDGSDHDRCRACQPGQYQDKVGESSCTKCDAGHYQPKGEWTKVCETCPGGKFQDQLGRPDCKSCPAGRAQAERGVHSGCKHCIAGTYQNAVGQASCKECAVGFYQDQLAGIQCKGCPKGRFQSEKGARYVCELCAAGWYAGAVQQELCAKCSVGKAPTAEDRSACAECVPGRYAAPWGQCVACAQGMYQQQSAQTSCELCSAGMYQDQQCNVCAPGQEPTISNATRVCQDCVAGKYSTGGSSSVCVDCPGGQYQPNKGRRACIPCEDGMCWHSKSGKMVDPPHKLNQDQDSILLQWTEMTNFDTSLYRADEKEFRYRIEWCKVPQDDRNQNCTGRWEVASKADFSPKEDTVALRILENNAGPKIAAGSEEMQFYYRIRAEGPAATPFAFDKASKWAPRTDDSIIANPQKIAINEIIHAPSFKKQEFVARPAAKVVLISRLMYRKCKDPKLCSPYTTNLTQPSTFPTNISGCRVGHEGPMCLNCIKGWAYDVRYCKECPTLLPSQGSMLGSALSVFLAPIILFIIYKKISKPYNMAALGMVMSMDDKEGEIYFAEKDEEQRAQFLRDLRRAQVLDHLNFNVQARRVCSLLPDHTARTGFFNSPEADRLVTSENVIAQFEAGIRAAAEATRTAADAVGGGWFSGLGRTFSSATSGRQSEAAMQHAVSQHQAGRPSTDVENVQGAAVQGAATLERPLGADADAHQDGRPATNSDNVQESVALEHTRVEEHSEGRPVGDNADLRNEAGHSVENHSQGRPMGEGNEAGASGADAGTADGQGAEAGAAAAGSLDSSVQIPGRTGLRGIMEQWKITISFAQVTAHWKLNFDIVWPQEFLDFMANLEIFNLNLLNLHTVACATKPQFTDKFLALSFGPIFFVIFILSMNRFSRAFGIMKTSFGDTTLMLQVIFIFFFVIFPATCSNIFKMLNCDELADGSKWLVAQYSISCASDAPMKTWLFGTSLQYGDYYRLAWFMIIVFPVGVPLFVAVMLYKMRDKLFEPLDSEAVIVRDSDGEIVRTPHHNTSRYMGSLYVAYSSRFYYWEVIELLRKVLLTGVILLVEPGSSTQLATGCLISLAFMVAYSAYKPYLYGEDDVLQLLCQIAIFCTAFSGLLIRTNTPETDGYSSGLFAWILVSLNVIPIVVGISRVFLILYAIGRRIGAKRFVVVHLLRKGAIRSVLKTAKFKKIDPDTGEEIEKNAKTHAKGSPEKVDLEKGAAAGTPKQSGKKMKGWGIAARFARGNVATRNPTKGEVARGDLESQLAEVDGGGQKQALPHSSADLERQLLEGEQDERKEEGGPSGALVTPASAGSAAIV
eukprot:g945.t1